MNKTIRRGEIYYIDLKERMIPGEQNGIRPVIILQNDIGNIHSGTTIVAFLTTKNKPLPTHVKINSVNSGLRKTSYVMLEQIRTVNKDLLKWKIGKISEEETNLIEKALNISLHINTIKETHS
ncbi:mRNA interferase MazF [Enterococcus sp. DIV2402]|jgi:mRNA interferase MazF|uniref:mRNA interferase n=1 Tax=Candidatus Enterococcus lowellii TaxID=2230877 RepID=A0ABZ2SNH7_9ENTE|nr:type II toxin-antitoxin system PemK/MazF family toxin [Enterococcus sp. DIV2402]MBO0463889.1 type II toxin-antitoxin system PemK/MazF family toxin [Enterococcus sp. DIV2402]